MTKEYLYIMKIYNITNSKQKHSKIHKESNYKINNHKEFNKDGRLNKRRIMCLYQKIANKRQHNIIEDTWK